MKKIPFFVTLVHLLLVLGAIYIQPRQIKLPPKKSVQVKTIVADRERLIAQIPNALPLSQPEQPAFAPKRPLEPTPETESRRPPPTRGPTLPPPRPTIKKETVPPLQTRRARPTPQAVGPPLSEAPKKESKNSSKEKAIAKAPKNASSANHDKLISMMQKSLATLDGASSKGGEKGSPKKGAKAGSARKASSIGPLASESLSFEAKYEEELVSYLEALLSFPEDGEVKVKLTLNRSGSVQKVEIVKASSTKNRNYIENSLASCSFPAFGTHFKGEASHTFTLNLTSDNAR